MKYRVKFRLTEPGKQGKKLSINLGENAEFVFGVKTLGIDRDLCKLVINHGVTSVRGMASGGHFNNKSQESLDVKPGDLYQAKGYTVEFLEVPFPDSESATQFLDITNLVVPQEAFTGSAGMSKFWLFGGSMSAVLAVLFHFGVRDKRSMEHAKAPLEIRVEPTSVSRSGDPLAEEQFMDAARSGDLSVVKFVVERGQVDLNAQDPNGTTPMMWAAFRGHDQIVKYLIEKGADPSIRRKDGESALDIARRWNHPDVVAIFETPAPNRNIASEK